MLEILCTLGKPPESLWAQWVAQEKALDKSEQEIEEETVVTRPLVERVAEIRLGNEDEGLLARENEFSEKFIEGMVDLLTRMLVYEPERRLTATEVLAHPWMKALKQDVESQPAPGTL